jgi:F-type H+-transporting ATPase subunit b
LELNWSTFVLEIINFLILVWILKRFFYLPVMKVIEQRRKGIEDSMAQADAKRKEAQEMEQKYQGRLSEWEKEKKQALEALHNEINAERAHLMESLKDSLEKEKQKNRVLEERRLNEEKRKIEQEALAHSTRFAAKFLNRLTGPELEERLYRLLLDELPQLPTEQRDTLHSVYSESQPPVKVTSAYSLAEDKRNALQAALSNLIGKSITCEYVEDTRLVAGLRINLGPLVLRANIQDELQFFSESAHGTS